MNLGVCSKIHPSFSYFASGLEDSVDFSKMFHVKQVAFSQLLSKEGFLLWILDNYLTQEKFKLYLDEWVM